MVGGAVMLSVVFFLSAVSSSCGLLYFGFGCVGRGWVGLSGVCVLSCSIVQRRLVGYRSVSVC